MSAANPSPDPGDGRHTASREHRPRAVGKATSLDKANAVRRARAEIRKRVRELRDDFNGTVEALNATVATGDKDRIFDARKAMWDASARWHEAERELYR